MIILVYYYQLLYITEQLNEVKQNPKIMKVYYYEANQANQVCPNLYQSKKEALKELKLAWQNGLTGHEYKHFKTYIDDCIGFITFEEMNEAVHKYGSRKRNYWT